MTAAANRPQALYLHVPFCRTICYYCDFCHEVYRRETALAWLQAVKNQLEGTEIGPLKTIYIGGGTPTSLDPDLLDELLGLLDPYRRDTEEYTIEINPETLTDEKAELLRKHGVNRASLGFQTADETLLQELNRHHTPQDVEQAAACLRSHDIDNISLDLMYSLPGQTMASLQDSVHRALEIRPDHLSLYSLTVEPDTVFGRRGIEPLDEDTEADMYEWICRTLPAYGYEQYEISNFARCGRESRHNLVYWHYEDFIGISCGASGKEGNVRYDMPARLSAYLADPLARDELALSEEDMMFEMIMMGLRLKNGISEADFSRRFGIDLHDIYGEVISRMTARGLLTDDGGRLACTEAGFPLLNSVLVEFLPETENTLAPAAGEW
ncbi:MAG: radical SAM family heme chaperone HemW [Solobacterium sp.]|nr:radical SAM family heme chaperone HemW [Solobacterium sp.]